MSIQKRSLLLVVLLFCAVALAAPLVFAQGQGSALIFGTVTDTSGAVIPDAEIVVSNPATGWSRTVRSSTEGGYVCPQISAGVYSVTVSADGFNRAALTGIQVQVNESARRDVQLAVGEITTTIDVESHAELTNTYTAQLSTTIDSRRVNELPLNGRDVTSLVLLAPGVSRDRSWTGFYAGSSGFASTAPLANGNRNQSNNYMLDGVSNMYFQRLSSNLYPNPDAIEEFTLNTAQYSAEMGGAPGAQLSARTRSGTNQLHGSLFEFVRNGNLNARNAFDRSGDDDGLKRHQYGWAVGGPVVIPKVFDGRNRLFWSNSFQRTTVRQPGRPGFHQSLTAREKTGDFGEHLTGALTSVPSPDCDGSTLMVDEGAIFDPLTANGDCGSLGRPFANNVIPSGRLDPVMQNFVNRHLPNSPSPGAQISHFVPLRANVYESVTKMDLNLGHHQIMGRYMRALNGGQMYNDINDLFWGSDPNDNGTDSGAESLALTETWTISPSMLFTAGFVWIKNPWNIVAMENQITWQELGSEIVVDTNPSDPNSICREFSFSMAGRGGVRTWDKCGVRDNRSPYNLNATLKWITGKHDLSIGGNIARHQVTDSIRAQSGGEFAFSGQITGNSVADGILGKAATYTVSNFGFSNPIVRAEGSFFVQDNWRVNRRLTLNLGIRWEPAFAPRSGADIMAWYVPGAQSSRFPNAPQGALYAGDPGTPDGNFNIRWNQLAPRIGFALDPTGESKWAIRGGVGSYFGIMPGGNSLEPSGTAFSPLQTGSVVVNNPPNLVNPWNTAPFNGTPVVPLASPGPDAAVITPLEAWLYDIDTKMPNIWNWSLTVERSFGADFLLRAGYVANRGTHLNGGNNLNLPVFIPGQSTGANTQERRPDQNFGALHVASGNGDSWYQGLQLYAEKRYSNGLQFTAAYTLSKSIDTESSDLGWAGGVNEGDPRAPNYNKGLSSFDQTHVFSSSFIADLPKLQSAPPAARAVFGNWQMSSILTLSSGGMMTVRSSAGNSLSPGRSGSDRADLVPGQEPELEGVDRQVMVNQGFFNQAAFTNPAIGTRGTVGRNTIRRPGFANTDFLLAKNVPINERVRFQLRAEFFNLFNRVNLNVGAFDASNDVNNPNFGLIFGALDPRIIQFGLKLQF